ncbi:hypothetical protein ACJJTC_011238 [Scirpophaga incertulas]
MYMGRPRADGDALVDDARPYVYEIINNLIAVHAEVDSVSGAASSRHVRDICETVNYLMEAMSQIPPLENEEDKKRMEELIGGFEKKMELQLASLNCNLETV